MSIFIIFFSMDKVWIDQCQDCGKRFPNASKLNRHSKRVHGPRLKCNFCWWSCQSHQRQRLLEHERAHHHREGFVPAETPAFSGSVSSVIVPVISATDSSTPQQPLMSSIPLFIPLTPLVPSLTEEDLQLSMPDFADLLRIEPATPSPLKRLRDSPNLSPSVSMLSDQLFSKYLASPDNRDKDPSSYSPSDKPFLHPDPESPVPVSLRSPSLVSTSPLVPLLSPVSVSTPVPVSSPVVPVVPVSSIGPVSPTGPDSSTGNTILVQDVPLDLSYTSKCRDPLEIDCRVPTNIWKVIPLEPVTNSRSSVPLSTATRYDHLAHDPRLFFAGAPSSYLEHPLASTLQSTINLCRKNQQARYQRRLLPVGNSTIVKEERCYLPDGTIMELRDIWTKDITKEE